MKKFIYSGLLACSIVFTACNDKKEEDAGAAAAAEKANLGPLESVEAIRDDISAAKVGNIWVALPESYRTDVEGLVHTFGENVDKDLYDKGIETAGQLNSLLKSKKSIIIELINDNVPPENQEQFKPAFKNWDNITDLLGSVLASDLQSADRLKSADVAQFLADIEPQLKPLLEAAKVASDGEFEKFASAKLAKVSQDEDKAVLSLDGEEVTFVKIEDRWLPEDMVNEWPKGIAEAKEALSNFDKMTPEDKQQALAMMTKIQEAITKLENATTKEEFQKVFGELMQQF